MKFQDLQGPETHEERVKSLAGLSPNALSAMVIDCAYSQKVDWLNSMLDCGLFNLENVGTSYGQAGNALAFLHSASLDKMAKTDPEYGVLDRPSFQMRLNVGPEIVDFFKRFVAHLVNQKTHFDSAVDSNTGMDSGEVDYYVGELFAITMVAASALGLPDDLQRLVQASTLSASYLLNKDLLGGGTVNFMAGEETHFKPYVFAMQFSDTAGMEILRQAAPDMDRVAMVRERTPSGGNVPKQIDIFDAVGTVLSPLCVPSAFAKALRDRLEFTDAPQGAALEAHIERILSTDQNGERRVGSCMIAYEKEGIFNQLPTLTARLACIHGHADLIPNLVGIEWKPEPGGVQTQPPWLALDAAELEAKEGPGRESMAFNRASLSIAAYWNRAIADGHPEVVTQLEVVQQAGVESATLEPLQRLIDRGLNDALLPMLKAGLSPTDRPMAGLPSPLEMATEAKADPKNRKAEDAENLLRSFSARGLAHSLIDEMGLSPFLFRP